jgi:hypothetical protein
VSIPLYDAKKIRIKTIFDAGGPKKLVVDYRAGFAR